MVSTQEEREPILGANDCDSDDVYQRFSPEKKKQILGLICGCGLIPLFVTGSFTPSIAIIAKELGSSPEVITTAVSVTIFAQSLGGLIGSAYSTHYGRRPVYLYSLPLLIIGSIGVAFSPSVPSLLFWRFIQAIGPASSLVLGAGVIGDIYKVEERGRAMGIFFAACLVGPAIAPFTGGLLAHYASWRFAQAVLGLIGLVVFTSVYLTFPETSQPGARGVDNATVGDSRSKFAVINPLRPVALLRSPVVLSTSFMLTASLASCLLLLVPVTTTVGIRYEITDPAVLGLIFVPAGVGNIVGAFIIGRLSDNTVIRWKSKRGGVWRPEDRLRAALIPFGLLVPVSTIAFGFVNRYVDGTPGVALSLVCLFVNGVGVEMAFGPPAAYLVDVLHSRSAEGLAANNGLRAFALFFIVSSYLPSIKAIGLLATATIAASFTWIAYGLLWLLITQGKRMRAWVDVGFSVDAEPLYH